MGWSIHTVVFGINSTQLCNAVRKCEILLRTSNSPRTISHLLTALLGGAINPKYRGTPSITYNYVLTH